MLKVELPVQVLQIGRFTCSLSACTSFSARLTRVWRTKPSKADFKVETRLFCLVFFFSLIFPYREGSLWARNVGVSFGRSITDFGQLPAMNCLLFLYIIGNENGLLHLLCLVSVQVVVMVITDDQKQFCDYTGPNLKIFCCLFVQRMILPLFIFVSQPELTGNYHPEDVMFNGPCKFLCIYEKKSPKTHLLGNFHSFSRVILQTIILYEYVQVFI